MNKITLQWPAPRPGESFVGLDSQTKLFVLKWLNPRVSINSDDPWADLLAQASQVNWQIVAQLIWLTDYGDEAAAEPDQRPPEDGAYSSWFVKTAYWRTVALNVKERDGHACCRCKRTRPLEAHHKSYRWHGSEHLHLEDLETLCAVCHKLEHGLIVEAVLKEWACAHQDDGPLEKLRLSLARIYDGVRDDGEVATPKYTPPVPDPTRHNFGKE